jgi:hypothetical protein
MITCKKMCEHLVHHVRVALDSPDFLKVQLPVKPPQESGLSS